MQYLSIRVFPDQYLTEANANVRFNEHQKGPGKSQVKQANHIDVVVSGR